MYYQSKLAVMQFTDSLSRRHPNVNANAVNPGVSSTDIGRYSSTPFYAVGMALYSESQSRSVFKMNARHLGHVQKVSN